MHSCKDTFLSLTQTACTYWFLNVILTEGRNQRDQTFLSGLSDCVSVSLFALGVIKTVFLRLSAAGSHFSCKGWHMGRKGWKDDFRWGWVELHFLLSPSGLFDCVYFCVGPWLQFLAVILVWGNPPLSCLHWWSKCSLRPQNELLWVGCIWIERFFLITSCYFLFSLLNPAITISKPMDEFPELTL